jgi:hypothetical protein
MWKVKMYSQGVDITLVELRKIGENLGILFPPDYEMFVLMGLAGGQPHSNTFLIRPDMGNATLSVKPQKIEIAIGLYTRSLDNYSLFER